MKVDRERFFWLVSALAAGCHAVSPPARAPETRAASEPPIDEAPAVPDEAPSRPATRSVDNLAVPLKSTDVEGSRAEQSPYSKTKVAGKHCDPWLNTNGFPRSCVTLRAPSPTCESIDGEGFDEMKAECGNLALRLKPRVAEKAVDCVLAKSGTRDLCVMNVAGVCAYEALVDTCVERSAAPVCARIVSTCAGQPESNVTQESCEAGFSALRESERSKFVACMTESCDFEPCLAFW